MRLLSGIKILVEGLYKAVEKIHKKVQLPYKKTRKNVMTIKPFNKEEKGNIFFKDIAGNEEAKENAKDIVDFLK